MFLAEEIYIVGFVDISKYDGCGFTPFMRSCIRGDIYGNIHWANFFLQRCDDPQKQHRDHELVAAHFFYGFLRHEDYVDPQGMEDLGRVWQEASTLPCFNCRCSFDGYSVLTSFLTTPTWNEDVTTYDRQYRFLTLLKWNWIPVNELKDYYRAFARIEIFERLEMTHTCPRIYDSYPEFLRVKKISSDDAIEIEDEEGELAEYLEQKMRQYDKDLEQYTGTLHEFHVEFMRRLAESDLRAAPLSYPAYTEDDVEHDIMAPGEPHFVRLRRDGTRFVQIRPYHDWIYRDGTLERYLCNHREYVEEENMLALLFGEE